MRNRGLLVLTFLILWLMIGCMGDGEGADSTPPPGSTPAATSPTAGAATSPSPIDAPGPEATAGGAGLPVEPGAPSSTAGRSALGEETPGATPAPVGTPGLILSIDMDSEGNAPNLVGAVQPCRSSRPGSTFVIDIVAERPEGSRPIQGFQFDLTYPLNSLTINAVEDQLLIAFNAASGPIFDFTDSVPSDDGRFRVAAADFGDDPGETGGGVLARLTLTLASAASGTLSLGLEGIEIVGPGSAVLEVGTQGSAVVLVEGACP